MDYNKKAFSLTELLIVLVVLAVLFAALAPIITKRRSGAGYSNEAVWNYVNSDDQKNAFFDPGMHNQTSAAYVGYDPNTYPDTVNDIKAKMVIRAMPGQRQIQFRYGDGYGVNAGSFFVDNSGNLMLAGDNNNFVNRSNSASSPTRNVIVGASAARIISSMSDSISYGAQSLAQATSVGNVIAVGGMSGNKLGSGNSGLVIGASSARTSNLPSKTVLVGAKSATSPNYSGAHNVYLGAETGNGQGSTTAGGYNVVAGSTFFGNGSKNKRNTIIGYDTYSKGQPEASNLTAAGFAACDSLNGSNSSGSRTCIGYFSAATSNGAKPGGSDPYSTDSYDHIFLGGQPFPAGSSFVGRSVLEVHNHKLSTKPNGVYNSPTVIMNSNIVVRGNIFLTSDTYYFTSGLHIDHASKMAYLSHKEVSASFLDLVNNSDHCRRWAGIGGRKKWRTFASWRKDDPWSSSMLQWDARKKIDAKSYNFPDYMPKIKTSDLRLKENISENNDGINSILKLMPYNYVFKDDKQHVQQVGVMAQDLQKVFKNSVKLGHDGYLHIRWDEMFYAAINSVKQMNNKIDKLATDISNIETDIKDLNSSHKNLKKKIAVLNSRAARLERR